MAYETNLTRSATEGLMANVTATISKLRAKYERYSVYRTTLRELNELSDRELNDLGMNRSILRRIAYQAAYDG